MQCRPDTEEVMPTKDYERLGAIRFSILSSYGPRNELQLLLDEYLEYFKKNANELRGDIVKAYRNRAYKDVYPLHQRLEQFELSAFVKPVRMAKTILAMQNAVSDPD